MSEVLIIDNYDSFVHNLARHFRQLGQRTKVVRNDAISLADIRALSPATIVISPGPCTPDEAGISLAVVDELAEAFPILGVCLGHQCIVQGFGGQVIRSGGPMHGRSSAVEHTDSPMFAEVPSPLNVGRYHSLIAEKLTLPECLKITALANDGTIMAVEHKALPVVGLQFHPESILTEKGYLLLTNFLKLAGVSTSSQRVSS